jgi:hypothetical protein
MIDNDNNNMNDKIMPLRLKRKERKGYPYLQGITLFRATGDHPFSTMIGQPHMDI